MTDKNEPRTLVFSFDGTGNEPSDMGHFTEDESITNILKLHILMGGGIATDNTDTKTPSGSLQTNYYYNGIGTREGGRQIPLLGRLCSAGRKFINMMLAPSSGDAKSILNEAKDDFQKSYKNGDKLVVFGFSRGAALARKFASIILAANSKVRVSFLGVFDTVAAMSGIHRKGERISSDVVFENGTLNERIEKAVHIVSIDEYRVPFTPTLINADEKNPERITEVWFPGVHSDVGGGYWFDGLSDIALEFMIKQCRSALDDHISIQDGRNIKGVGQLLTDQGSALEGLEVDDIAVRPMAHGVMHTHHGLLSKMQDQEPRSVHVCVNDRPSQDLPVLHEAVKERFDKVASYRPPALRGLKFRLMKDGTITKNTIHGISELRGSVQ